MNPVFALEFGYLTNLVTPEARQFVEILVPNYLFLATIIIYVIF